MSLNSMPPPPPPPPPRPQFQRQNSICDLEEKLAKKSVKLLHTNRRSIWSDCEVLVNTRNRSSSRPSSDQSDGQMCPPKAGRLVEQTRRHQGRVESSFSPVESPPPIDSHKPLSSFHNASTHSPSSNTLPYQLADKSPTSTATAHFSTKTNDFHRTRRKSSIMLTGTQHEAKEKREDNKKSLLLESKSEYSQPNNGSQRRHRKSSSSTSDDGPPETDEKQELQPKKQSTLISSKSKTLTSSRRSYRKSSSLSSLSGSEEKQPNEIPATYRKSSSLPLKSHSEKKGEHRGNEKTCSSSSYSTDSKSNTSRKSYRKSSSMPINSELEGGKDYKSNTKLCSRAASPEKRPTRNFKRSNSMPIDSSKVDFPAFPPPPPLRRGERGTTASDRANRRRSSNSSAFSSNYTKSKSFCQSGATSKEKMGNTSSRGIWSSTRHKDNFFKSKSFCESNTDEKDTRGPLSLPILSGIADTEANHLSSTSYRKVSSMSTKSEEGEIRELQENEKSSASSKSVDSKSNSPHRSYRKPTFIPFVSGSEKIQDCEFISKPTSRTAKPEKRPSRDFKRSNSMPIDPSAVDFPAPQKHEERDSVARGTRSRQRTSSSTRSSFNNAKSKSFCQTNSDSKYSRLSSCTPSASISEPCRDSYVRSKSFCHSNANLKDTQGSPTTSCGYSSSPQNESNAKSKSFLKCSANSNDTRDSSNTSFVSHTSPRREKYARSKSISESHSHLKETQSSSNEACVSSSSMRQCNYARSKSFMECHSKIIDDRDYSNRSVASSSTPCRDIYAKSKSFSDSLAGLKGNRGSSNASSVSSSTPRIDHYLRRKSLLESKTKTSASVNSCNSEKMKHDEQHLGSAIGDSSNNSAKSFPNITRFITSIQRRSSTGSLNSVNQDEQDDSPFSLRKQKQEVCEPHMRLPPPPFGKGDDENELKNQRNLSVPEENKGNCSTDQNSPAKETARTENAECDKKEEIVLDVIDLKWTELTTKQKGLYTGTVNRSGNPHGRGKFTFGNDLDKKSINSECSCYLYGQWDDGHFVSEENELSQIRNERRSTKMVERAMRTSASFCYGDKCKERLSCSGSVVSSLSGGGESFCISNVSPTPMQRSTPSRLVASVDSSLRRKSTSLIALNFPKEGHDEDFSQPKFRRSLSSDFTKKLLAQKEKNMPMAMSRSSHSTISSRDKDVHGFNSGTIPRRRRKPRGCHLSQETGKRRDAIIDTTLIESSQMHSSEIDHDKSDDCLSILIDRSTEEEKEMSRSDSGIEVHNLKTTNCDKRRRCRTKMRPSLRQSISSLRQSWSSLSTHDGYQIGDKVHSTEDMIIEPSKEVAIRSLSTLEVLDFAFVRRSSGDWTYAILAGREFESLDGSSNGDEKGDVLKAMVFVLNDAGETKRIDKSKWTSCIRRFNSSAERVR